MSPDGRRRAGFALPLGWGLAVFTTTLLVSYAVIAVLALRAAQQVGAAESALARYAETRTLVSAGVGSFEQARADLATSLGAGVLGSGVAEDVRVEADAAYQAVEDATRLTTTPGIDAAVANLHDAVADGLVLLDRDRALLLTGSDPEQSAAALLQLRRNGSTVQDAYRAVLGPLDAAMTTATVELQDNKQSAAWTLISVSVAMAVLVLAVGVVVVLGQRRRLRDIAEAASRVGQGDLDVRAAVRFHDEIGRIAAALNDAVSVQETLVRRLEADAERVRVSSAMDQAFDMVDVEPQARALAGRALGELVPDHSAALLLTDASRAHLRIVAANAAMPPPTCPVASLYDCIAVRRGSLQVFGSNRDLDACPRLAGLAGEPIGAACVPVTFMGKALGVVHVTAAADHVWDPDRLALLGQFAALAGTRIGTIQAFERTQVQAETDGLTGLPNRRTFESRARVLLASDGPLSLALLDLDHFKRLNDTYGHEAGDRALRAFAAVVRARVRDQDLVARIGGEEFAVIMPNATVTVALEVLDRLREGLSQTAIGDAPAVTVSGGLVGRMPGDTLDHLLRVADRALYRAKRTGRDRIAVAGSSDAVADAADVADAVDVADAADVVDVADAADVADVVDVHAVADVVDVDSVADVVDVADVDAVTSVELAPSVGSAPGVGSGAGSEPGGGFALVRSDIGGFLAAAIADDDPSEPRP